MLGRKGYLISVEGPDTAGKSTQVELLKDALTAKGERAEIIHFPDYHSPYGKLIADFLRVDRDRPMDYNDAFALQLLYIADQQAAQTRIRRLLDEGVHVILDRYDLSTMIYTAATLSQTEEGWRILEDPMTAVRIVSCCQSQLMQPNLTFVLDLPATEISKRKAILDRFESNEPLMAFIADMYQKIGKEEKYLFGRPVVHINATKTPKEVHREIFNLVEHRYLNQETHG